MTAYYYRRAKLGRVPIFVDKTYFFGIVEACLTVRQIRNVLQSSTLFSPPNMLKTQHTYMY